MENKKPEFPRNEVIDRQIGEAAKKLQLKKLVVRTSLRAGAARYGLPQTYGCEA